MSEDELYEEFVKIYPSFKPMVVSYKRINWEPNSIQIFTKQGKSFIFGKTGNQVEIKTVSNFTTEDK